MCRKRREIPYAKPKERRERERKKEITHWSSGGEEGRREGRNRLQKK